MKFRAGMAFYELVPGEVIFFAEDWKTCQRRYQHRLSHKPCQKLSRLTRRGKGFSFF